MWKTCEKVSNFKGEFDIFLLPLDFFVSLIIIKSENRLN